MKSFFTKLSKVLLCGVAVAVVGCTDYDTDIQNVNERVDAVEANLEQSLADLGAKVNANAAAIEALEATLNSKIAEEVNNLNAAIDKKADKATVDQQFEALNATLAEAKTALETAIKTNADAIEGALARITALETAGKALQDAVAKNAEDIAALQTELAAQVEALYTYIDTAVEEIYTAIQVVQEFASAINTLLQEEVARLDIEDAAIWEKIETIEEVCTNLANLIALEGEERKAADDLIYQEIETLRASISSVYTTLDEKIDTEVAELNKTVAELTQTLATVYTYVSEVDAALAAHIAAFETYKEANDARVAEAEYAIATLQSEQSELQKNINTISEVVASIINVHAEDIATLNATLNAAVEGLNATIETTQETLTVVIRIIDGLSADVEALLGRVQSIVYVPDYSDHKATLDWATVVSERGSMTYPTIISKASDLKYLVKADDAAAVAASIALNPEVLDYVVKGVKTRSQEADLEIVNVKAEGEYIIVSVVAKNFANDFYTNPQQGIYSAALVLADENNTRTTEFTNLVPAAHHYEFEMVVYVPEDERIAEKNEVIPHYMVCNDTEAVETAVKPVVKFAPVEQTDPATYFDVEYLVNELGYDITIETAITIVDSENTTEYDGTNETAGELGIDKNFDILAGDPLYDFHYTVKPGVSFEDNVGKKSTVEYQFTCGNAVATLTHAFILSNAQVEVYMEVNDVWTVAKQHVIAKGEDYVIANVPYTTKGGEVANLKSVLFNAQVVEIYVKEGEKWVATETLPFWAQELEKDGKGDIVLFNGKYDWNNSYKVVVRSTNDQIHADFNTTIVVNLTGKPAEINIPAVETEFALYEGMPYFFGNADDLYKVAFKEMQKYFGYEDPKTADEYWTAEWTSFAQQDLFSESQKINGKPAAGITIFNKEKVQAMLAVNAEYPINVTEDNVITFTAKTVYDIPVNFTIKGKAVLPAVELLYSHDFVNFDANTPYVIAEGEIDGNGIYSIVKSDLAKYFNVEAETVLDHEYTVEFQVVKNNYVTLERPTALVCEKEGNATYHYLEAGSILDWAKYTGLEVDVIATLYVNGYKLQASPLKLITIDPLTLTGSNIDKERKHREDTKINVFEKLVLTSVIEPGKGNLLDVTAGSLEAAAAYAQKTYGAKGEPIVELVLGPKGVYYVDANGKDITINSNKYSYNSTTGVLVIYGDDSVVKQYKADFTAVLKSRICARPDGSEENAAYVAHNVHFQVTATMK